MSYLTFATANPSIGGSDRCPLTSESRGCSSDTFVRPIESDIAGNVDALTCKTSPCMICQNKGRELTADHPPLPEATARQARISQIVRPLPGCSNTPPLQDSTIRSAFALVALRDHNNGDTEKQEFKRGKHSRGDVSEISYLGGEREQRLVAMERREEKSEQDDGGNETG